MVDMTGGQVYWRQCLNRAGNLHRKDAGKKNPRGQDHDILSESVTLTRGHHFGNFFITPHNIINR